MAVDDPVLPLAEQLLECLCARLDETVGGPVCRCSLYPGTPPADECCDCGTPQDPANGQASVHIDRSFPSTQFPTPDTAPPAGNCAITAWAVELIMTVYRCVHTIDSSGTPPTVEELTADTQMLASDEAALRTAAVCCFTDENRFTAFGSVEPIGPSGGCAGRRMTITVEFTQCCPDES